VDTTDNKHTIHATDDVQLHQQCVLHRLIDSASSYQLTSVFTQLI